MNPLPTYDELRAEALPYAKAIVAARELPERFNQADVDHAVGLEVGAIASTAVTRGQSVLEVVQRHYPRLFPKPAVKVAA